MGSSSANVEGQTLNTRKAQWSVLLASLVIAVGRSSISHTQIQLVNVVYPSTAIADRPVPMGWEPNGSPKTSVARGSTAPPRATQTSVAARRTSAPTVEEKWRVQETH